MTTFTSHRIVPTDHPGAEALADRYFSYLDLPDRQLDAELRAVIRIEHDLPEPLRYEAALGRLRAWLELSPEDARILARAHAEALAAFPEQYVLETQEAERAVILNAMTFDEFKQLAEVLPWLRDGSWLPAGDTAALEIVA